MNRLRALLPYAQTAYAWARAHPKTVLAAAAAALHVLALAWTDVPSEAILKALSVLLGA